MRCVALWDMPTWHSFKSRTAWAIHDETSSFAHVFPLILFAARLVSTAVCLLYRIGVPWAEGRLELCSAGARRCMFGCWLEGCCCTNVLSQKTLKFSMKLGMFTKTTPSLKTQKSPRPKKSISHEGKRAVKMPKGLILLAGGALPSLLVSSKI